MKRPLFRVAFVTLVIVSVALTITGLDGVYSKPVWADVIESLQPVTSATYNFSVELPDSEPTTGTYWVHSAGRFREESNDGSVRVVDYEAGKVLNLLTNQKRAVVVELTEKPTGVEPMDYFLEIRKGLLNERTDDDTTREALGRKNIDGRDVIGFRLVSPERTTVIWGNPASGLPFRIEITKARHLRRGAKVTLSDFDFNPSLDDALFSVTPPPGYTVETRAMSLAEPKEEDFVNALDSYSELSKGRFPRKLDVSSYQELARILGFDKKMPQGKAMKDWMDRCEKFSRGFAFALGLPPEAKAAYAGASAGRGESNKAVFWYQPVGSDHFRVLYADLTVRETNAEPSATNVQRLNDWAGRGQSD